MICPVETVFGCSQAVEGVSGHFPGCGGDLLGLLVALVEGDEGCDAGDNQGYEEKLEDAIDRESPRS